MADIDIDVILMAGRYSLLDRSAVEELLPLCEKRGTSITAAGSVATSRSTAPFPIVDKRFLAFNTGSGQSSPRASISISQGMVSLMAQDVSVRSRTVHHRSGGHDRIGPQARRICRARGG